MDFADELISTKEKWSIDRSMENASVEYCTHDFSLVEQYSETIATTDRKESSYVCFLFHDWLCCHVSPKRFHFYIVNDTDEFNASLLFVIDTV